MRKATYWAILGGWVAVCWLAAGAGFGADADYEVVLDRPLKVGDTVRVVVSGEHAFTNKVTEGDQPPQETSSKGKLELTADMEIQAVDKLGRPTRAVCTVREFSASLDDKPVEKPETADGRPEVLVVTAQLADGQVSYTIKDEPLSDQARRLAEMAFPIKKEAYPGDDEVLGTKQRKKPGDEWEGNKEAIVRIMAEFFNVRIEKDKIATRVKLVEVREVEKVPCLHVETEGKMRDWVLANAPAGGKMTDAKSNYHADIDIPVDKARYRVREVVTSDTSGTSTEPGPQAGQEKKTQFQFHSKVTRTWGQPIQRAAAQEPERKAEAAKSDEAALQGTWIGRVAGEPVAGPPDMVTMIVRGADCEFKTSRPGLDYKGTLALNPAANPKQVDYLIKERGDPDPERAEKHVGKTSLGIYKIDEDGTLTLAANEPGVATRPEKFEPAPPQGTVVFVFKKWAPGLALPGNPPELKVLEKRIGTWATQTIIKPNQWAPKGHKSTGTETTEWILGGRFQQSRSANRPADPDGVFLCTYDPQIKALRAWYHDDQGSSSEMTGQWDEAAQTINWTSGDKDGVRRTASTRFVGPDNIEWQMTVKDPDGKVMVEVAGKLVRKK